MDPTSISWGRYSMGKSGSHSWKDCVKPCPVLYVRINRTSPQPCEQKQPVGPPHWFLVPYKILSLDFRGVEKHVKGSSCLRRYRLWGFSEGKGVGLGRLPGIIHCTVCFQSRWGSLNPVWYLWVMRQEKSRLSLLVGSGGYMEEYMCKQCWLYSLS